MKRRPVMLGRNVYAEPNFSRDMTADALNTIIRPIETSKTVTTNIQRSTLTRLATHRRLARERRHEFLEDASAVLVTLELIKTRACRRQ